MIGSWLRMFRSSSGRASLVHSLRIGSESLIRTPSGSGLEASSGVQLSRVDLLILDDWGPEPLLPDQQRDLLEIAEDRYNTGSLIITSQLPVYRWYELVGNPTLADAILDRIVHNAYRVELSGESLRKPRATA
jgi:DNA replication protein DnaC